MAPHRSATTTTRFGWKFSDALWFPTHIMTTYARTYARACRWIYTVRAVIRSVRLPVRVENKTFRLSDDEPWNGKPRARIHRLSVGLGVVRRRVCLSLTSVSHACARGQRGACVRREYPRSGAVRRAVRVRVSCVLRRVWERSGRRARTITRSKRLWTQSWRSRRAYARGACVSLISHEQ